MLTKNDLQAISGIVNEILDKKLKPLKRNINILLKDVKYMSGKFDEEIVYTSRRVERIEKHLKLPVIERPPHQN